MTTSSIFLFFGLFIYILKPYTTEQYTTIPYISVVFIGISNLIYSCVMWPCIPLIVPIGTEGTGFGIASAI